MKRLLVPLLLVVTMASVGADSTQASVSAPVYLSTIGGPGHAQIYASGLDVDAAGNVYVADTGNDQVKKFAPNGTLLWNVGVRGVKAPGNFDNPRDIAYLNGKLYVADLGNKRVQVLDASTGAVDAVWTETFPSTIGISAGVDGSGNPIILVTEDVLNQTRIYTPSGTFIRADGTGSAGSGAGQLNAPRDAATDSAGNVYVADYANNRIAKFGPTGAWITSWGTGGGKPGQFRRPYGVTVDVDNNVWVADSTNHRIQEFTSNGTFIRALGSSGTGSGQFFMLRRVAVTPGVSNPDVYGTDLWGNKIERFHYTSGSYSWAQTYAGSHAPTGLFNEPAGVAVDGTNVFVADSVNQRMQRFATSAGAFQTTFGQRGWGSNDLTGMNWPRDIAIEGSDTTKSGSPTPRTAGCSSSRATELRPDGRSARRAAALDSSTGTAPSPPHRPASVRGRHVQQPRPALEHLRLDAFDGVERHRLLEARSISRWRAGSSTSPIPPATRLSSCRSPTGRGSRRWQPDYMRRPALPSNPSGDVWVADTTSNRLVELDPSGAVLQTFGSVGAGNSNFDGTLTHPQVFNGHLYVCDTYNDRVQVFDVDGSGSGGTTTQTFHRIGRRPGRASQTFKISVTNTSVPIQATLSWPTTSANLNLCFLTLLVVMQRTTDRRRGVKYSPIPRRWTSRPAVRWT